MNAGKLRHRVVVAQPTTTKDEFGQEVETFVTLANRWASVEPLAGRELLQAQQVQAETTHRVRMRGGEDIAGIDSKCQILWGLKVLRVQSVIDKDGRGIELELMCAETK